MCFETREIKRAGVIARTNDNKYLMVVHGKNGKLSLPKGVLEENEDFITCATRETKEETGIDVSINENTKTFIWCDTILYYINNMEREPDFNIQDNDEVDKVEMIDIRDLSGRTNMNSGLSKVVKKLIEWGSLPKKTFVKPVIQWGKSQSDNGKSVTCQG